MRWMRNCSKLYLAEIPELILLVLVMHLLGASVGCCGNWRCYGGCQCHSNVGIDGWWEKGDVTEIGKPGKAVFGGSEACVCRMCGASFRVNGSSADSHWAAVASLLLIGGIEAQIVAQDVIMIEHPSRGRCLQR